MPITIVLKIGGALITDKEKPFSLKYSVLHKISKELSQAYRRCNNRIIIVHGGGSYGHYVVKEHGDIHSMDSITQVIWFMRELNMIVTDMLNLYGLPALPMDTHAVFLRAENRLHGFKEPLMLMIDKGFVPVLYGDIIFSTQGETEILSGDEIAWYCASLFRPSRLLFATSVDGVFDKDPINRDAKLIPILKLSLLDSLYVKGARGIDVTGGMETKLLLGLRYMEKEDMDVYIFNGMRNGNIFQAICSEGIYGTRVVK
uniref:Isopentenyl phosphate kinase n=1 Tax=Ignisphaera aggregans TaxID=334771 RepID=A0A7J3QEI3_9CREN